MKKHFQIIAVFLIVTLWSCRDHEKSDEKTMTVMLPTGIKKPHIFIGNEKFKNKKAEDINNEGVKFVKNGEFLKGEEKFREALKYEPNNSTILNNLGNFEDYMGYKNKAVELYKESFVSSDSSYYNAAYNLGRMYCKLGKYHESEKILNYIQDNFKEPEFQSASSYLLANVYLQLKNCEKAKTYYLKSKKLYDSVPELRSLSQELSEDIEACRNGKIE